VAMPTDQIVNHLLTLLPPLELLRICELSEAERLSGLSRDSLVREHRDKVIRLAPRRLGMRVAHALMLQDTPTAA
jgi:hypothetical protein